MMKPVYIQGRGFAWLHFSSRVNRTTVIVCPALRLDDVQSYATWRLLADDLADCGYTVLRLQYPGTGNSPPLSTPGSPGNSAWSAWLDAINASAGWAHDVLGAERIVLCGFRVGALLAAAAASARKDVAGLILLAPMLHGRAFLRQTALETQSPGSENLDMGLFELDAGSGRALAAASLHDLIPSPHCKVLVLAQAKGGALGQTVQHWQASGVPVTSGAFEPLAPMLRPAFMNHEGPADVRPLLAWLRHAVPDRMAQDAPAIRPQALCLDGCLEEPVCFGADNELFGVLCRPAGAAEAPVVIIGNPSGEPHCVAPTVDLARQLAKSGIPSLRMDFSGIGDSGPCGGTHVFEADRGADFAAAVDALAARGYDKVAVAGVCSGAYHAYRFAILDERVRFLIAINLPFFEWVPRPVQDLVFDLASHPTHPSRLRSAAFWRYLLFRAAHGRLPVRRGLAHALRLVRRWTASAGVAGGFKPGRAVRMLFLTTDNDASSEAVAARFGPVPPAGVTLRHLGGVDHGMSRFGMRRIVADAIAAFLAETSPIPARSIIHDDAARSDLRQDPLCGSAAAKIAGAPAG